MSRPKETYTVCDHCTQGSWVDGIKRICRHCNKPVDKRPSDTMLINPDWKPYWSHNMDHEPVYVDGRTQYREELKRRGLICVG